MKYKYIQIVCMLKIYWLLEIEKESPTEKPSKTKAKCLKIVDFVHAISKRMGRKITKNCICFYDIMNNLVPLAITK